MSLLLVVALSSAGKIVTVKLKAILAEQLIEGAWQKTLANPDKTFKPWHWADTWPVARLKVDRLQGEWFVLAGASGRNLAFGPSHVRASAKIGERGVAVLGAHRDTQFANLHRLKKGDKFEIQTPAGEWLYYQVDYIDIADARSQSIQSQQSEGSKIALVTCYPFNALQAGSPLRYVVTASLQQQVATPNKS